MKQLFCLLLLFGCAAGSRAQSSDLAVAGRLISADGQAIGGLVIATRHGNTKTLTAADGSFTIRVTIGDTLDISGTGYQPVVMAIGPHTRLPLFIEPQPLNKELAGVTVNTGYQKISRERSTGSYTQLGKELLNQQTGTTVLERLESISNGLYVDRQTGGGANRIIIRGLSTIKGPAAPLIVLDDFPYEGNLNNINPNDVESITILKDAAAASIWGTRAGNGVIVITTKRGRYNQPTKVEVASSVLVTRPPDLGYIKQVSPQELVDLEVFLYGKGYYTSTLTAQPYSYTTPVIETLLQRDRGTITAAAANAQLAAIAQHNVLDDFKKYVYRNGVNYQTALSANGGSKNMALNISVGYDRNADVLGARYDRYKLRDGHLFKIGKRLELSVGLDYTQSVSQAGQTGYTGLRPNQGLLPMYTRLADDNGNALAVNNKYRAAYTDTAGRGNLLDWKWYPLSDHNYVDNTSKVQAVLADIGVQYKLTNSIGISVKYQYGKQWSSGETVYGTGSYFTRNLINQYSAINSSTGKITYNIPPGAIADRESSTLRTDNVRGQVNFNKTWGLHRIDAIGGAELRQAAFTKWAYRTYGFNESNLRAVAVDYVNRFADFLSGATNLIPDGSNNSGTINRNVSLYVNAAYTYHNKYTVSGSARRDASNLFGVASNDRWTPLWSAGAAWDIAKEPFYKFRFIPALKIRLSHVVSGNADPLRSAVPVIQYNTTNANTQVPVALINQFANPELKWEQVRMTNLGVDFTSSSTRISGSVDYYYKKATNLFGTIPVDYTGVPATSLTKNVAKIAGHGWDINLTSRNIIKAINWTSHLNLNFNRDKVLEYYVASKQGSNFVQGNIVSAVEGRPVYALYAYKWAGLDPVNGDPIGYLNGAESKNYASITGAGTQVDDLVYIGPTLPTVTASLGNSIGWRKLQLHIQITGKFGNYFQRSSIDYTSLISLRNGHTDYSQRWQQPGDEAKTNVPSLVYPNNSQRNIFYYSSEVLATKADLIRLQYVTLSYTIKKPAIQFYVNANNLGLLWRANEYGIDPEYQNNLPVSPNYAFGLRATF